MLVAVGLAVLAFSGVATPWPYFVLAFLGGSALVFDAPEPARADVPARRPRRAAERGRAQLASFNAGRIVGPAIGGVLIAAVGVGWCFAINAVTFLAVLAGLLLMRPSELYPLEARRRARHGAAIREGSRYVRRTPEVLLVLAITTVVATTGFNFRVLLPVLASKTLHSSATVFGVLFACVRRRRAARRAASAAAMSRPCWRALVLGAAGFSAAMLLLAPVRNAALAAALLLVVGFCFSTWTANSQSILQLTAPDRLRGRVLGLYLFVVRRLLADRRPARRLARRRRRHRARVRGRRPSQGWPRQRLLSRACASWARRADADRWSRWRKRSRSSRPSSRPRRRRRARARRLARACR